MPMCKLDAKETRCSIPENAVLAQTRLEANGRHSSAGAGRGLGSLSSMFMEDETNVKFQSQKWIDLEAGRGERGTSCNAPAPSLLPQVGFDKESRSVRKLGIKRKVRTVLCVKREQLLQGSNGIHILLATRWRSHVFGRVLGHLWLVLIRKAKACSCISLGIKHRLLSQPAAKTCETSG